MNHPSHVDHTQSSGLIRIALLGVFRISGSGTTLEFDDFRLRKAASIVKLLALRPSHQIHRDELIEHLWPELDHESALNNFYQALHVARRTLARITPSATNSRLLPLRRQILSLEFGAGFEIDVDEFERRADEATGTADHAHIAQAVELYAGELLPEDRYEEWTVSRRQALHERYLNLLLSLAQFHESRGERDASIDYYQRAVVAEPVLESAHRSLMSLYAQSGRRRHALRQYEQLRVTLRNELDVEPALATRLLAAQIERDDRAQRPWAPTMGDVDQIPNDFVGRHERDESVETALERGLRAIGHFAWQGAVDDLSYTLEALQSRDDRDYEVECQVMLALGDALWHGGVGRGTEFGAGHVPEARIQYLHAAELATALGRPDLLAHAALGVAGHCPKTTQGDLAGLFLLERALAGVSSTDNPWHARLLGRLALYHRVLGAVEGRQQPGGSDDDIKVMSDRSVEIAARLGDERLRGLMLVWRNLSQYGVDQLQRRLEIVNEVISIAHRHSDYELLAWALHEQHAYLVSLGHIPSARASMAQLDWIADYLRMPYFQWLASVQQGGLAFGRGDLAMAEEHQSVADAVWPHSGSANWLLFAIRREQERLHEVSDRMSFIAGRLITSPFQDSYHLLYLCQNRRTAEAMLMLELRPVCDYTRISRTFEWLPTVLNLVDTVLELGKTDDMLHLYETLLPCEDLDGYSARVRYPTGAVAGSLGRLAMWLGRVDDAERLLRRALRLNREREFLLHALWNEVFLGELALRSGSAVDDTTARLKQISNQASELGLSRLQNEISRIMVDV